MARQAAFRKKKKQNKGGMLLVTIVMVMFFSVIFVNKHTLGEKQANLIAKQESLEKQIAEQEEYAEGLVQLKKYTKTKKYAEEVAKDKLGLVYQDEIVFKPEK